MATTITVTDLGEGNTGLVINPIDAKGSTIAGMLLEALLAAAISSGVSRLNLARTLRACAHQVEKMSDAKYQECSVIVRSFGARNLAYRRS
jgi:hypothetical protein